MCADRGVDGGDRRWQRRGAAGSVGGLGGGEQRDLDELGHTYTTKTTCFVVGGVAPAWTQTNPDGTIYPGDNLGCTDWTELQHNGLYGNAMVGNILSGDSHWTDSVCGASCTERASLYSLEQ